MLCRWLIFSIFTVSVIQLIEADGCEDGCEDTKPNFSASGRRISEQKCREFNWERKRLEKCTTETANFKYPYMGALGYRNKTDMSWAFLCGTFLVSQKFVVTAAQCIRVPSYRSELTFPKMVRLGNKNIRDEVPRVDVKIRRTIVHPQYKAPIKYYDIALVELESEVQFTRSIYPACLWSQGGLDGVEYAGNPAWGFDEDNGVQRKVIAEMKVKVLDRKTCLDKTKKMHSLRFEQLHEHHICVDESMSPVLNCKGSAGAPVITTVRLDGNSKDEMPYAFGVTSFGSRCGTFGVDTRISSFIDWIEQNIWPTENTDDKSSKIEKEVENDPCNYDKIQSKHIQPDTNKVGRRVSDIKCEEYSWYYWAEVVESRRNAIACKEKLGEDASLVYGGKRARQSDFPHMGAVGWKLPNITEIKFFCASSLISLRYALSAGHCWKASEKLDINRSKPYLVRFGNTYIGSHNDGSQNGVQDVLVANFLTLREFQNHPVWKYNDIGLIELKEEVEITMNVRPACLWNGGLGNIFVANITGWGKTENGQTSNHLNYAEVNIIDKEQCKKDVHYRINRNWKSGLVDHQFCAGKLNGGVDSCQGDSGGPLQFRAAMPMGIPGETDYVVGITNFGIDCGAPLMPGIYTNVTNFLCWIEKTVWSEEKNEFCP